MSICVFVHVTVNEQQLVRWSG